MDGEPKAFTVHNGTLYLNVNEKVRGMRARDIAGNDQKAGKGWSGVRVRSGFDSMYTRLDIWRRKPRRPRRWE